MDVNELDNIGRYLHLKLSEVNSLREKSSTAHGLLDFSKRLRECSSFVMSFDDGDYAKLGFSSRLNRDAVALLKNINSNDVVRCNPTVLPELANIIRNSAADYIEKRAKELLAEVAAAKVSL